MSRIRFLGTSDSLSHCHRGFHLDLFVVVVVVAGRVGLDNNHCLRLRRSLGLLWKVLDLYFQHTQACTLSCPCIHLNFMGIHHALPYVVCGSLCSLLLLTSQLSLHLIHCFLLSLRLLTGHLSHKLIFCPHSRPTNCPG